MTRLVALERIGNTVGIIEPGQLFEASDDFAAQLLKAKRAVHEHDSPSLKWIDGIRWSGATVVCIASGPSLTVEQCHMVQRWRFDDRAYAMRRVIAINTTFRRALWADVLYACDLQWWNQYMTEVTASFRGELWTQDRKAKALGVKHVKSERSAGLNKTPGVINQGSNSGYQVINLAWQAGAARIVLLGYDMQSTGGALHWHAPHPAAWHQPLPYALWLEQFDALARDLIAADVPVLNCTESTALKAFQRARLETVLEQ